MAWGCRWVSIFKQDDKQDDFAAASSSSDHFYVCESLEFRTLLLRCANDAAVDNIALRTGIAAQNYCCSS